MKYKIYAVIIHLCEWVRCKLCGDPTYEEMEERIFELESEVENLRDNNFYLEEENDWMARRGGYR